MSLTHTNATLSDPPDKTEIEQNFSDTRDKFGNIVNADISSSAGIATSKLAARDYEVIINLQAIGWGTAGQVVALCALPYDNAADGYTVLGAEYYIQEAGGSGSPAFDVQFGYATGGSWVTSTTVIDAETFTANTTETGTCTIDSSTITLSATNQNFFRLVVDTAGTTVFASPAADEMLCVTLKLRRTNGLR